MIKLRMGFSLALLCAGAAFGQPSQWCPADPMPECNDDGTSCKTTCSTFGDPVTITTVNSFHKTTDFTIDLPGKAFRFSRTYSGSPRTWGGGAGGGSLAAGDNFGLRTPGHFGGPSSTRDFQWWDNFSSYVFEKKTGSEVVYVDESANIYQYLTTGAITDSWLEIPIYNSTPLLGQRHSLKKRANGYQVLRPDGSLYEYESRYEQGSAPFRLFQLTRIRGANGQVAATFQYGDPQASSSAATPPVTGGIAVGCPVETLGVGESWPYLLSATLVGGREVRFLWGRYPGTTVDRRCFLGRVELAVSGQPNTVLASFLYEELQGAVPRLVGVDLPDGDGARYSYAGGEFRVNSVASLSARVRHATQTAYPLLVQTLHGVGAEPARTVSFLANPTLDPSYWIAGAQSSQCLAFYTATETTANITGTTGDGQGTTQTLSEKYYTIRDPWMHKRIRYMTSDSCGSEACSPGSIISVPGPGNGAACSSISPSTGVPARVAAIKNKRSNWSTFTYAKYEATGTGSNVARFFLPIERKWGGTWPGMPANAPAPFGVQASVQGQLESEAYQYQIQPQGFPTITTTTRPSVFGGTSVEAVVYGTGSGGGHLVLREVLTGKTSSATTRHRGLFYSYDAADRLVAVDGPCWLANSTSTFCDGPNPGPIPRTEFTYFGTGVGHNSGRLQTVRRATNGAGQFLTTTFDNYTPQGDPGSVWDSNGVLTEFAYANRRPTLRGVNTSVGRKDTVFTYDEEKLKSVAHPNGMYEAFCYRIGAAFPSCSGTQVAKLQWHAKVGSAPTGVTNWSVGAWSERMELVYDSNANLIETRAYVNEGTSQLRSVSKVQTDLHGRPTFAQSGAATAAAAVINRAHYDGANNMDAFGPAYNQAAPSWCRSAGSNSPECWWFKFDRTERLYGAESPGGLSRTCIDLDKRGGIAQILTGAVSGPPCNQNYRVDGSDPSTAPPLAPGQQDTATRYLWDDFGNVVSVSVGGAEGGGQTRYEFDASGNVVYRQTAAMAQASPTQAQSLSYDALGRLTSVSALSNGAFQVQLYNLTYDSSTGAPEPVTFQSGRLARRTDSFGVTWYSYDERGRVLAELREKAGCNPATKGVSCSALTRYTWTESGRLASILYPFGRTVTYSYGSGEWADTIRSVSFTRYEGGKAKTRALVSDVSWEPYSNSLRGYNLRHLDKSTRGVEYAMGDGLNTDPGNCSTPVAVGSPDGSRRTRGLFVGAPFSTATTPLNGTVYRQQYQWRADQVEAQQTCLADTSSYTQSFVYDKMQRLTAEAGIGLPANVGESMSSTRTFDARGNRIDGTRDGYSVLDFDYTDAAAKDRLKRVGWWNGFLAAGQNFIEYGFQQNASGTVTRVDGRGGLTGLGTIDDRWSYDFGWSASRATSDAMTSVVRGGLGANYVYEYWYDAFNRRRAKRDALGDGVELYYDLGHQLLVDQVWRTGNATVDEYIWLGGKPVAVIRSRLNALGGREDDWSVGNMKCARPDEPGGEECGVYFVVTNLQSMPVLTLRWADGKVTGFNLPDADGNLNQPRFVAIGDWWTSWTTQFNLPSGYSKDARVRMMFTGGGPADPISGVKLGGQVVLSNPGLAELGRVWTNWYTTTGSNTVAFSVVCDSPGGCTSATDAWEYRAYETGATPFMPKLRFAGQYWDSETDLNENWHRHYDPSIGRYLSPEPLLRNPTWVRSQLQSGRQATAFSYAANNPIGYVDANGLWVVTIGGGAEIQLPLALFGYSSNVISGAEASVAITFGSDGDYGVLASAGVRRGYDIALGASPQIGLNWDATSIDQMAGPGNEACLEWPAPIHPFVPITGAGWSGSRISGSGLDDGAWLNGVQLSLPGAGVGLGFYGSETTTKVANFTPFVRKLENGIRDRLGGLGRGRGL